MLLSNGMRLTQKNTNYLFFMKLELSQPQNQEINSPN